jgi:hypothetical protein
MNGSVAVCVLNRITRKGDFSLERFKNQPSRALSKPLLHHLGIRLYPRALATLPGSANDTTVLYGLTAVGLIFGVLVLLGAIMLHIKPVNNL